VIWNGTRVDRKSVGPAYKHRFMDTSNGALTRAEISSAAGAIG
jgi:hypothetical protein